MANQFPIHWFVETIDNHFGKKIDTKVMIQIVQSKPEYVDQIAIDIQSSIDLFNSFYQENSKFEVDLAIILNTVHLKNISPNPLPTYLDVIDKLQTVSSLYDKVISELTTSDYFQEVYTLEPKEHIIANLQILLYRTAMLQLHPQFRKDGAQFSSVIEEMSALGFIYTKKETELFKAIKHWILDWEDEGFSQELYNKTVAMLK